MDEATEQVSAILGDVSLRPKLKLFIPRILLPVFLLLSLDFYMSFVRRRFDRKNKINMINCMLNDFKILSIFTGYVSLLFVLV